jgi:hypothetical protein
LTNRQKKELYSWQPTLLQQFLSMLHFDKRTRSRLADVLVTTAALLSLCATALAIETITSTAPVPVQPGTDPASQNAFAAPAAWSAGMPEILKMLDAKVDPEVIIAYVKNSPFGYHPSAAELIELRNRGASADVLKAILEHAPQTGVGVPQTAPAPDASMVAPQGTFPTYTPPATYPGYDSSYPDYGYASYPYYGYGGYYPYYPYYYSYWPWFSFGWYWPYYYHYCYYHGHYPYYGHYYGHYYGNHYYGGHYYNGYNGGHWNNGYHPAPHASGAFVAHGNPGFHGGNMVHSGGFAGGGFAAHGGGGGGGHGGGGHR